MLKLTHLLTVIGSGVLLSGCFHSGTNSANTPAPTGSVTQETPVNTGESMEKGVGEEMARAAIEIKDFKYSPATITLGPGETFTVTNLDLAGHSVTSDDGSSFDTGVIGKDQSKIITAPTKPGTYKFHCTPHPSITGTLVVGEG